MDECQFETTAEAVALLKTTAEASDTGDTAHPSRKPMPFVARYEYLTGEPALKEQPRTTTARTGGIKP